MFRQATDAALSYRLPYVEVYTADLVNPVLGDEVQRLASGLTSKAPPSSPGASTAALPSAAPPDSAAPPVPALSEAGRALGNGTSSHVEFVGPTTKQTIAFSLYLPRGYAENTRRFPVLFWLHGKGGDERRSAHVARYLDRAIAAGQMPPTIMIIPNGGTDSFYTDSPDGSWPIETMLMDELLPYVDSHYRTLGTRAGRVIMGFSMGGFGALKFAAKYPDRFAAVVGYGAPRLDASLGMGGQDQAIFTQVFGGDRKRFEENTPSALFRANRDRIVKLGLKIRLVSGSEDGTRFSVEKLDQVLTELKVPHEHEALAGVRHMVALYYDAEAERGFAFLGRALASAPVP
jgi:S-formylglutathione hydrolase FrmB